MKVAVTVAFVVLCLGLNQADARASSHGHNQTRLAEAARRVGNHVDNALEANNKTIELVKQAAGKTRVSQSKDLVRLTADAWQTCREAKVHLSDAMQVLESIDDQFTDEAGKEAGKGKQFVDKMKEYLAGDSVSGTIQTNCAKTQNMVDDLFGHDQPEDGGSICVQQSIMATMVLSVIKGVVASVVGLAALVSCIGWLLGYRVKCVKKIL